MFFPLIGLKQLNIHSCLLLKFKYYLWSVGLLKESMVQTLQVMRDHRRVLLAAMSVFILEPSVDWLMHAVRQQENASSQYPAGPVIRKQWYLNYFNLVIFVQNIWCALYLFQGIFTILWNCRWGKRPIWNFLYISSWRKRSWIGCLGHLLIINCRSCRLAIQWSPFRYSFSNRYCLSNLLLWLLFKIFYEFNFLEN